MKRKTFIILIIFIVLFLMTNFCLLGANSRLEQSGLTTDVYDIDTSTNFFTQKENTEQIVIQDKREEIIGKGYKKISENNDLVLYRLDKTIGIAIYDKTNGYTWFSCYENYKDLGLTSSLNAKIESGVSIEYYDANGSSINTGELSFTSSKVNNKVEYSPINNGFKAKLNFPTVGISFDLEIYLEGKALVVNVPYESIKEVEVGKLTVKKYQLKAIYLYPYFGSQNYQINGYSFIPDGSGALIRYSDQISTTAYMKKVYGVDLGISQAAVTTGHIKLKNNITLPIFGINHGYNQAAFLCQIESGDGACELHSYPYMYSNLEINTTFFKFNVRDTYTVSLSSSSNLTLINDEVYPTPYTLRYTFLENESASYTGMALEYKKSLDLSQLSINNNDIPLHLNILGMDYKAGLFGKNYVPMTTYQAATNIIQNLESNGVKNVAVSYLGWSNGGYFNNGSTTAQLASCLGNKSDFLELNRYLESRNYSIDYTINPLISSNYGIGNNTIKKLNLSPFEVTQKSSLVQTGYYVSPLELSKKILSKSKKYDKLGINSFNIDNLSNSYSYRFNSEEVYRSKMILQIQEELEKLNDYVISTSNPNAYLYRYLENYYEANYEASKYLYETDSVPFISILLSGSVNIFSPNFNYISDTNLMKLRSIEYNLYPSYIITENEAYSLRFTNFEYLNSTQYDLWKEQIIDIYCSINNALNKVRGHEIISHKYIDKGVCEIKYDNGLAIYINYNAADYVNGGLAIESQNYIIRRSE